MTPIHALVNDLRTHLPATAVVSDPAELPAYGHDFWAARGVPGVVVRAESVDAVVATLRFAETHGVPVVPRAAGTNIGIGFIPTPERILLDLRPLDRIISIDAEQGVAIVEPGVLNGDLQARLAPLGLRYAPDPASAAISTIGGNIAENAGGPHCLKYGVTYHHVDGITCVLPGGYLVRFDASTRGPDLLGLMIGSEGTLGVVTEARLRLQPAPAVVCTLMAVFDRVEDAVAAVSLTIASGIIPGALEFFDREAAIIFESFVASNYPTDAAAILLIDIEGAADEVAHDLAAMEALLAGRAREVRRAADDETRRTFWRGRILSGQALRASGYAYAICDTTVPRERIPALQRAVASIAHRHNLRIMTNGHAGDGNIHPVILYNKENPVEVAAMQVASHELVAEALRLGGTLTGEHGVGSEKRSHMAQRFTVAEIAAQRAVKHVFDPRATLNPGILLPDLLPGEPLLPRFSAALLAEVSAQREGLAAGNITASVLRSEAQERDAARSALDAENLSLTVDAHMPIVRVHQELADHALRCSLPTLDDPAVTVGAVIAGDADRAAVRDCLLAVQVRLPDGDRVRFGSAAVKDVAGYDMKRLYIGSGDTFGTLEEVTLKVAPERS